MKVKIFMAALVVATIAALVFSLGAFAQNSTTTTLSSNSSACTPVDSEAPVASTGGTSNNSGTTGTSGSTAAASTPAATSTPVASPTATTGSSGAAGTSTPSASTPSATTPSASTPSANPSPTATTSGTSGTGGTTNNGGNNGAAVAEPHETTFCSHGMEVDIAVPHGGTVSLSSTNIASGIPVTGNSSSNGGASPLTSVFSSGPVATIKISNANGAAAAAHMEVCFNNNTKSGHIYQWWSTDMFATWFKSTTTAARWVPLPTTNTSTMACAQSWLPGTYMLIP